MLAGRFTGGPVLEAVREACQRAKLDEAQSVEAQNAALAALRATGSRKKALREAQKIINRYSRSTEP